MSVTVAADEPPGALPSGRFIANGVNHRINPVPPELKHSWHHLVGKTYNDLFDQLLADFRPDFLFTFRDESPDQSRSFRACEAGAKVVFCLHNARYAKLQPADVNAFLAPSKFLADFYRSAWGKEAFIAELPTPMIPERVVSIHHESLGPRYTRFLENLRG